MVTDKQRKPLATLPAGTYLSINRCNLPAVILGSLTFQQHPAALTIDGVLQLHRDLFSRLEEVSEPSERAQQFIDYMAVHFCLHALEEAGFSPELRVRRPKADYFHVLRGWGFNAEGREGAILKGWVESRFGLIPRYHEVPIRSAGDPAYLAYQRSFAEGIYNTNSLEAQLDLVYTYCQYELARTWPGQTHLTLYRGSNDIEQLTRHSIDGTNERVVLLNNINSFSRHPERADEFGDAVLRAEVPLSKIFFHADLLPGYLKAEGEVIVLGGVYRVERLR